MESDERMKKLKSIYFIILTFNEVFIGICFIVGSIMFFYDDYVYYGTWLFLIGSILMVIKPLIKFIREMHYYKVHKYEEIIKK